MIDLIKIYGERNSGTRYMRRLLIQNLREAPDMLDSDGRFDGLLGWKHGYPMLRPHTLYIVMLRPVYDWLRSMYSYPYECHPIKDRSTDFADFVTRRFYSSNRSESSKYCGEFDSILHARWSKYQAYYNLFENQKNVILFNIQALKYSPNLVPDMLAKVSHNFTMIGDRWQDISTSVADPKEQTRTRSDRYEITLEDRRLVNDIIGRNKMHFVERMVDSLSADVS